MVRSLVAIQAIALLAASFASSAFAQEAPPAEAPAYSPPFGNFSAPGAPASQFAAPAAPAPTPPKGAEGQSQADFCKGGFNKLMGKRQGLIDLLNKDSKSNKGKMNPITACPRLTGLASIEGEIISFLVKNKEWCGVPDQIVDNVRTSRGKTSTIAGQACKVAKMVRQQQQQQAAGAAQEAVQKLPSGPL